MNRDFKNSNILVCDDSFTNTLIVTELLKSEGYDKVEAVNSPELAITALKHNHFDLLLLDIEMPNMTGLELMQYMRANQLVDEYFPVIILSGVKDKTVRNEALDLGAVDYITKPFDQDEITLRVKNTLKFHNAFELKKESSCQLELEVNKRTVELLHTKNLLIQRLATLGELKDNETGRHVLRVGAYAELLAEQYGLPQKICRLIGKAAPLHDIGKVAIPDTILLKEGPLSDEEWQVMKTHTTTGQSLLADIESDIAQVASTITVTHHENWDGTGYPYGLLGESIPVEGRITAISDVFDALISSRSYKRAWTLERAFDEINALSGTKFDPTLVQLFNKNIESISDIYNHFRE